MTDHMDRIRQNGFTRLMKFKGLRCVLLAACFALCSPLQAVTIFTTQFAGNKDYSNSNPPTGGSFRDVRDAGAINRGTDLKTGTFTTLNLTTTTPSTPAWGVSVFDTDPVDKTTTLLIGDLVQSMDFMVTGSDGSKAPGLLALYNEGSGQGGGLVLAVENNGSGDRLRLYLLSETGEAVELASVDLSSGIGEGSWYNLEMTLSISGDGVSVIGQVFQHADPNNPNSSVGGQIAGDLVYSAVLSDLGLSASGSGQVGIAYRSGSSSGGASVTNYRLGARENFPVPPLSGGGDSSEDDPGPGGPGSNPPGGNPPGGNPPGGNPPGGGDPPSGGNPPGDGDPPPGGNPPGTNPPGGGDPTDPPGTDPNPNGPVHTPEPGTWMLLLGGLAIFATLAVVRASRA